MIDTTKRISKVTYNGRNIPVGPAQAKVEEKDVNFIDFDGTLLHSYTKEQAMALSALPDPPDHSGDDIPLVFDRWNYSLEDIKEELEDTGKATVGANYHTADGLTHLVWKVEAGEQVFIHSVSSGTIIDWGDGETTTGTTGSYLHTYADAGVYDCKVSGILISVGDSTASFRKNLSRLYGVRLPQGITSIETYAFINCYALQSVSIPQGITSIEGYAFGSCYSLQSITIPQSVTSIGSNAFQNCYALQSVSIPQGITSIEGYVFSSCSSLQSITIPQSVTSIGGYALQKCYALQSVYIPQSVTSIGGNAFSSCSSLQSITIPQSVTSIGGYVFSGCSSLQSITIPQGITRIEGYAFGSCYSLQSITIPQSVTSIGGYAFGSCYFAMLVFESDVPPTISATTAFSTYVSKVVVPKGCLETYKSATNLTQLASKMVEADE